MSSPPTTSERRRGRAGRLGRTLVVVGITSVLLAGCYGVDYRFQAMRQGSTPVAQRCGSMPFAINPHGADASWQLVAVVTAVKRLEAATGVDWRFTGYTNERIATGFDPRLSGGRVLVEFTTFEAPGTPIAYGHAKPSGPGDQYMGGYVYLYPSRIRPLDATALVAVIEHELGHVWGLDHASAPPELQLMSAAAVRRSDYGSGDRTGLQALTRACMAAP